ncbi:prepilin-type N-terminal cleavage/methylation domain-containing protein [Opitutaceae bacterium TAV4]|nr:prepilin-type N-terminal cleavage/methylation domain-containing protein [Opitutaceae bacterium TAV4]RRK01811.1 prepilin-type N-terminal cleavage/methylation domain-containing protein [Opitutaceae bacterium TAV3]
MDAFRLSRSIVPQAPPTGFTLIELLTVIAIIGILAGITIPVVSQVRGSAEKARCVSNLKNLYLNFVLYAQDNKDRLPTVDWTAESPPTWWRQVARYHAPNSTAYKEDGTQVMLCPTHLKRIVAKANVPASRLQDGLVYNYGMNGYLGKSDTNGGKTVLQLGRLPKPSRTILLTEGSSHGSGATTGAVAELNSYWINRHNSEDLGGPHKGSNNILWCDGHVSNMKTPAGQSKKILFDDGGTEKYWKPDA